MFFSIGTWNSREDDQKPSIDTSHFHEHDDTLRPSNGVALTEEHSREEDTVFHDRQNLYSNIVLKLHSQAEISQAIYTAETILFTVFYECLFLYAYFCLVCVRPSSDL